ncbi:hypothetical protein [Chitinophaga japonensis]|uniref:HEAT repeat protein n=1 Tax=Chitinophaga japonensis TaxID=104662 RepID=A0A562T3T4_CHIJA|nr:hypothetical protein [Chitinophaga japonensis]TWI87948.1 hypothetical protein LX66_2022 [Chitinophaga japonensis]
MTDALNQILAIVNATGKLKADGIPTSLINQLSEQEKQQVENILVKITLSNDLTGLEALAALRTDKAVQTIKTIYDQTGNDNILKIKLAKLLWEATNDNDYLNVILKDFGPQNNTDKLTLISTYLQLPPQTVPDERYMAIINQESYQPMRFQAGKGLLYNLKILTRETDVQFGDPLHDLLRRLSNENPETRAAALKEVRLLATNKH